MMCVNRQPVPATYAPYEPLKQAQRVAPAAQRVTPAARAGARRDEPGAEERDALGLPVQQQAHRQADATTLRRVVGRRGRA